MADEDVTTVRLGVVALDEGAYDGLSSEDRWGYRFEADVDEGKGDTSRNPLTYPSVKIELGKRYCVSQSGQHYVLHELPFLPLAVLDVVDDLEEADRRIRTIANKALESLVERINSGGMVPGLSLKLYEVKAEPIELEEKKKETVPEE